MANRFGDQEVTAPQPGPIVVRGREDVLGQLDRLNTPQAPQEAPRAAVNRFGDVAAPPRATDEERRTVLGFLGNAAKSTGSLLGGLVNVPEQVKGMTAPPPERSPVQKTAQAFWEGIGGQALMDLMAGAGRTKEGAARTKAAAQGLVHGIAAEPGRVWAELGAAGQAMIKGDLSGTAYRLAGAVPFLGAGAQQVALDLDRGDPAAAVGHTAALVLPFAGKPLGRAAAATGRAAAAGSEIARAAAKEAVREAAAPSTMKLGKLPLSVPVPRIVSSAVTGKLAGSYLAGPTGGAVGLAAGAAAPLARGAVRGAREALKARAARAAEALAAETEAAAATAATPTPAPGIIPPERQLGPGPIITPAPEDTSFVRAVPAELPEVIPPGVLRSNPQAADAAIALREAMGLGPEEFRPPAAAAPDFAAITQAGHVDRVARLMRENGLTASDAMLLDPPDWINLARSAGIENPQAGGALARDVVLRLQSLEPPPRKPPARTTAPTAPRKPPAAEPAAPEPAVATAAEANAELGKLYPAAEQIEKAPALTSSQRRIEKIAADLAPDTKLTSTMLDRLPTDRGAQLLVEKLGHGRPAAGEYQSIVDRVRDLRAAPEEPPAAAVAPPAPPAAPLQPTPVAKAKADFEAGKAAAPAEAPAREPYPSLAHRDEPIALARDVVKKLEQSHLIDESGARLVEMMVRRASMSEGEVFDIVNEAAKGGTPANAKAIQDIYQSRVNTPEKADLVQDIALHRWKTFAEETERIAAEGRAKKAADIAARRKAAGK